MMQTSGCCKIFMENVIKIEDGVAKYFEIHV